MDAYFDLANFVSYVLSHKDAAFSECNRLLRKNFNLKFNFSKEDLNDLSSEELTTVKQWVSAYFIQGFKGELQYCTNFPERPLIQKFYNGATKEQFSSIYLLDDPKIRDIKRDGILLVGGVGEEIGILTKLMVDDYECNKQINSRTLNSWNEIKDFIAPCSDILLCDQFILNRDNFYSENLCKLMQVLSVNANQTKINVVIFATKEAYDNSFRDVISGQREFAESIISEIKKVVKREVKAAPYVTIVLLPKDLKEHDRMIFTNYRSIDSGDSFSYFRNNENLTKGRKLNIDSLAKKDVFECNMNLINDLQGDVDETQKRNPDLIIGDKVSNYLKFSPPYVH